jgi:hypothetical protein
MSSPILASCFKTPFEMSVLIAVMMLLVSHKAKLASMCSCLLKNVFRLLALSTGIWNDEAIKRAFFMCCSQFLAKCFEEKPRDMTTSFSHFNFHCSDFILDIVAIHRQMRSARYGAVLSGAVYNFTNLWRACHKRDIREKNLQLSVLLATFHLAGHILQVL